MMSHGKLCRECSEAGCDDVTDCDICRACRAHCPAIPNHVPSHRAMARELLERALTRASLVN